MKTLKTAALAAAIAFHSYAANLTGNIPMDFRASGVPAAAGDYQITETRPGLVVIKTRAGKGIAIANMPVRSSENSPHSVLTFTRKGGEFHLTGYCTAASACWSTIAPSAISADRVEVALVVSR